MDLGKLSENKIIQSSIVLREDRNLNGQIVFDDMFSIRLHKMFVNCANEFLFHKREKFTLNDPMQKHFYGTILRYFSRSEEFFDSRLIENKNSASLDKGLLVCGSNGVGKTFLFKIMNKINSMIMYSGNAFAYHRVHDIVAEFDENGESAISHYNKGQRYFDDLGTEEIGSRYKQSEVFRKILENRHVLLEDKYLKTHLTTNAGYEELLERYGSRVESRFFEMFNVITVTGVDRRK